MPKRIMVQPLTQSLARCDIRGHAGHCKGTGRGLMLEPSRTATYVKYPYLEYPHRQSDLAGC